MNKRSGEQQKSYFPFNKGVHQKEKYHYPGRGTLDVDIYESGLHPRFSDDGLHLAGDIVEAIVGGCANLNCFLHLLCIRIS